MNINDGLVFLFNDAKSKKKIQTSILQQNLMSIKEQGESGGFLKRGKRRSKKDKEQRRYLCGCGKDYLSYPALYTHIKNKHNGIAPEGTSLPQNKLASGKQSIETKTNLSNNNEYNNKDEEYNSNYNDYNNNFIIADYNFKLLDESKWQKNIDYTITNNNYLEDDLRFWVDKILNKSNNEELGNNIVSVFTKFLIHVYEKGNKIILDYSLLVISSLYNYLNIYGYKFILLFLSQNKEIQAIMNNTTESNSFCEQETCLLIPCTFDFFILYYLPNHLSTNNINISFAIAYIFSFSEWLYNNKYTILKINLNN